MAIASDDPAQCALTGQSMTEDEFMALPKDGYKHELVDGRVTDVATIYQHGRIAMRIGRLLGPAADEYGDLLDSNAGFRLADGNIRVPDVAFVTRDRAPRGPEELRLFDGAPDLAIEVISSSENKQDMARKVVEYLESGTRQVWQVFPATGRVVVYHSLDRIRSYEAGEILDGGDLLPGFQRRVADLFERP